MPRSTRMFEIIQLLRAAKAPMTADQIAEALEVSTRTIYRDIAALQSMRTPIEGEAGVGYILRPTYDLPPINLDIEEAEAVRLGLAMIARTGDTGLLGAAQSAARKLGDAAPDLPQLISSSWGMSAPDKVNLSALRCGLRENSEQKLHYRDAEDRDSERVIWPLALIYYYDSAMLAAWCTLREDFRHFRVDRMIKLEFTGNCFDERAQELRETWARVHKEATVVTTE